MAANRETWAQLQNEFRRGADDCEDLALYICHFPCAASHQSFFQRLNHHNRPSSHSSGSTLDDALHWHVSDGEQVERSMLLGSSRVVRRFKNLSASAGAALPLELRIETPFFVNPTIAARDFLGQSHKDSLSRASFHYTPVAVWLQFLAAHTFKSGLSGSFIFECDHPGCLEGTSIARMQTDPFTASALAIGIDVLPLLPHPQSDARPAGLSEITLSLKLNVDLDNREISREPYAASADLAKTPVLWRMFFALANAGPGGMSRDDIRSAVWPNKEVGEPTLDKTKKRLEKVLSCIRIKIKANNRGVWSLAAAVRPLTSDSRVRDL